MTATGLGAGADRVLAGLSGAGAVGEWVLAEHPDYDQPIADLTRQLRTRLALPGDGPVDATEFSTRLQQRIQQDFPEGKLLRVQSWQLSATEALAAVLRFKAAGVSAVTTVTGPVEGHIAEVSNWGPRTTTAGVLPNSFGEGFAALWFDAEDAPRWAQIAIDGQRLHTTYRENRVLVGTFRGQLEFQKKLFSQPGEYPITLHDDMTNTWQHVATFVVTAAAISDTSDTEQPVE